MNDCVSNQLYYSKTLSGETLQTSDRNFNVFLEEYTPKEQAYWKKALSDLIHNNLIREFNYKNEIFELTTKEYEFYDLQKAYKFANK